jgi:two-component system cell cycle sensor histidine kinase/response regulator CckA
MEDNAQSYTTGTMPASADLDLRLLERQLDRRTAQLERAVAALDRIAVELSHDLTQPVTMIAGFGDLLSSRYACELDADGNDFISYILKGAEQLQRMIEEMTVSIRTDRVALGFPIHGRASE